MLAAIRAFAKSWVAAGLMVLLIASFALWGIRDVFHAKISDAVIVAGSRSVSADQFKREFDQTKAQYEKQAGQPITTEFAVANGLDKQILEGMATREAFAALMARIGLLPSDKLVVSQIQKIPAFFDPVSGRFDKASYQQRLGENGLTVAAFEQMVRDDVGEQMFSSGLVGGVMTPRAYTAMAAVYGLENRDVALATLEPQNVPAPPPPTDAQLTDFMKENAARLMRPEFRAISIVRFSPAQMVAAGPVDQAEVLKRFNFRKDTLSKPETRSIVQIPAKDAAAAAQITARLARGEAPDAIARSLGVAAISYGDKPQTAIPDGKVAAAAFQAKPGQVQTVQGNLGLAVVRVDAVSPGHTVTLEEIRPAIEAEVRKDAAASKIDALTQAYDDAHTKGATLAEAAQKAGVPVAALPPVAKQGIDQQGHPVPGLTQKIVDTAFALPPGGESELVDAGGGEYFALKVDKVIPPAMPALADVKAELTRVWMMRQVVTRLQAKAEELAARVKKGESLDAVAASAGAKVTHLTGLSRQSASQNQQLGQELIAQVFTGKPGDVFVAGGQTGVSVGKIEAIRTADIDAMARAVDANRGRMTEAYLRELLTAAHVAARDKVKVRIDPARARTALGLDPNVAKPAGKAGLAR